MLTTSQILAATNSQLLTKNILTEYYQHELLQSIFNLPHSENFSFIGGTAIRICYGGMRYSEDLDFDTTTLEHFDTLIPDLVSAMQAKGFEVEFRIVHKGAYHCYIKFPHILKKLGISGYSEEKLLIKLDATKVDHFFSSNKLINKYGVFQQIKAAPPDVLLSKKLLTVMARKRPKGRDLYDITFLWSIATPNLDYLNQEGNTNLSDIMNQLSKFVQTLDLKSMAQEVSPFLINASDSSRVLLFQDFLESHK